MKKETTSREEGDTDRPRKRKHKIESIVEESLRKGVVTRFDPRDDKTG